MSTEFLLKGLPADNPLGFMAALGVVVTACDAFPIPAEQDAVRLGWSRAMGGWRPTLHVPGSLTEEGLVAMLHGRLHRKFDPAASKAADERRGERDRCANELKKGLVHLKELGRKTPSEVRAKLVKEEIEPARRAVDAAGAAYRRALAQGGAPDLAVSLGASLKQVSGEAFGEAVRPWALEASSADRRLVDLAAGFGSDGVVDQDGNLEPTQFSKHNGAGGRNMLADVARLMTGVVPDRITAALFWPWTYSDEKLGLGWDPADARSHALMAENPEKAGSFTMHGANLLAFEGLRLMPAVPSGRRLTTTGTSRVGGVRAFSWPIWSAPLGVEAIRTLVALGEAQEVIPNRTRLARLGVEEVYRSEHFTFGKYPRFRPARAV